MKAPSCTSCRLRRRKCDKQTPICGSCKELGIPADLCTYKILKTNTKVKDLRTILDDSKLKNQKLITEKLVLKKALEDKKREIREQCTAIKREKDPSKQYEVNHANVGLTHHMGTPMSQISEVRSTSRGPFVNSRRKPHGDSISWASLMSMEPKMKVLLSQIDRVITDQKTQLESSKRELKYPLKNASKLTHLRATGIAHALELDNTDICADIHELLEEIQTHLPNKRTWDRVLELQFHIVPPKYVGFLHIDHSFYQEILNRSVEFDNLGNPSLKITLPEEADKLRDLGFLISYLIFTAYHTTQVIGESFPMSAVMCSRYSETLLWYHRIISVKLGKLEEAQITPEYLQALIYNEIFNRYTPHGEYILKSYEDNAFCIRRLVSIGRVLHLNQNVDQVYMHRSEAYRNSLKSTWNFLAFFDIMESLDNGFPPSIKPNELVRYQNFSDRYTESLIVLNKVLHTYIKLQRKDYNDAKFIQTIENDCIGELQELLATEYRPWDQDYQLFMCFTFEDSSRSREFTYESASFNMRFTIYSTIQIFYFLCFEKASKSEICSTKLARRLEILSLKYSYLLVLLINAYFEIYDKLITLPKSSENGVLEMMLATFPHLILALRKLQVCAGAKIFRSIPLRNVSAVKTFLNGTKIDEEAFLREVGEKKKSYKELFTIGELSDSTLDKDDDKIAAKYSPLMDFKFVIYVAGAITGELAERMFSEKSSLRMVKLNHVFFYLLKLSSFFMNCSFYSDGTPIENHNNYIKGLHGIKPQDSTSFSTEFDFQRLFEEAINTNSESFDFGGFFNISNGAFQNSEIDEFLSGYPSFHNDFGGI